MIKMLTRIILSAGQALIVCLLVVNTMAVQAETRGDVEKSGVMDEYSRTRIVVDGTGYVFCPGMKIFNNVSKEISWEDLDAAEKVVMFFDPSAGCVKKIKVLTFRQ